MINYFRWNFDMDGCIRSREFVEKDARKWLLWQFYKSNVPSVNSPSGDNED